MDLQDTLNQIQAALDKQKSDLDAHAQELSDLQAHLDEVASAQEAQQAVLDAKEAELNQREASIADVEADVDRKKKLDDQATHQAEREAEQNKRESDLADMYATVKQAQDELAAGQRALSDEKATYKQTLRDEFFAEVAKRLPQ